LSEQDYTSIVVIVVDDSSNDGTTSDVKATFPHVILLSGDGSRWWSGSMNLGLAYVLAHASVQDYVLSFNDDVVIEAEFLTLLVSDAIQLGSRAIVGSIAVDSLDSTKVVFRGTRIDWLKGVWTGIAADSLEPKIPIRSDSLPGRGTLIPITAFLEVGFYDACSFPQYFGDEDFALRAKKLGYSLHVSQKAVLASHVAMTGTGRHNQTLLSFFNSLFSIRSPNQLVRRLRFIWKHCPRRFFVSFALFDAAKVVTAFFRKKELRK
jgi:GT2 family glycosyltransferase